MKKVVVIFTGGTMSMRQDVASGGAVPALTGEDILTHMPEIRSFAEIEVVNFSRIPGPHFTPSYMWQLRAEILIYLGSEAIDGVVITHGTDTIEETAFLLDLTINTKKPIVLVGAMRNSSETGWDGAQNLLDAINTVLSPDAANQGVMVVMNNDIFAASEVTKLHSYKINAFQSPEFGPLGLVKDSIVSFTRCVKKRRYIPSSQIETAVELVKVTAGMDENIIHWLADVGKKGLVIEAMGSGNVPIPIFHAIKLAIKKGVKVVIVSRCISGGVSVVYGYDGGGRSLVEAGAIPGGHLTGQKARIKLMVALGLTDNVEEIRRMFA